MDGDAVEMAQCDVGQGSRDLKGCAAFGHAIVESNEPKTRRTINEDVNRKVFFLNEQPREKAIHAQPRRTIERAQVVTWNVGADIGEVDPGTLGARTLGGESTARRNGPSPESERFKRPEERCGKGLSYSVHKNQRKEEIAAIASSIIVSDVTPSAAAENRRRTRCRNAGLAQSKTSSVEAA